MRKSEKPVTIPKKEEKPIPCYICGSVEHTGEQHYRDIMCNRQMERRG